MPSLGTSNIAEWSAFLSGLSHCFDILKKDDLAIFDFYLDSKLVVEQFNGNFNVDDKFMLFYKGAKILQRRLGDALGSVSWVSREENQRADYLSKQGLLKFNEIMQKYEYTLQRLSEKDLVIKDITEARQAANYFFDSGEDEKAQLILDKVKDVLNKKL
jgi:hypothetical protein